MVRHVGRAPDSGRFFVSAPPAPRRFAYSVAVAVVVLVTLSACSSADPEIMQTDIGVVATFTPTADDIAETVYLLADVFDPDGTDEVAEVRIRHESEGLVWRGGVDRLRRYRRSGQEWYAFRARAVTGDAGVPRGSYRVEVEDFAQRTAYREAVIPFGVERSERTDFVVITRDGIRVPSGSATFLIVVGDTESDDETVYEIARGDDISEAGGEGEATTIPTAALDSPLRETITAAIERRERGDRTDARRVWFILSDEPALIRISGPW